MSVAAIPRTGAAPALTLPTHRDCYYGGRWVRPRAGRYADSINPGTGQSLGPVADGGADDVDAAVAAAKLAFEGWRRVPPLERARLLKRIAATLREHAKELAMHDTSDCGNAFAALTAGA